MNVEVRRMNYCQKELVIDGKRFVLTDMNQKKKLRKVGDAIINTVLFLAMCALIIWGTWIFLTHDEGHWAPDYVDENGVLYDIDGDGDTYHWVDPTR